jgi:hypothetical protein
LKWEVKPAFNADLRRLSQVELKLFRQVVIDEFIPAAERHVANPAAPWPKKLRAKGVKSAPGIWEMTWSFASPDGRATFEWILIDGEPAIRWRRVGGHAILREPAR